ncbi:MAG TPA: hypothetical protein VFH06_02255 [Candidatus Saccharimonadales bacterium]|nr:hypothetical protein [Candidatus Saccharimonadales bacterium]
MSRYIEFTSSPENRHFSFSQGIPVHDEELPTRFLNVRGLRIDKGEPVLFGDTELIDRLHRALVETKRLESNGAVIDCLAFVALMCSMELPKPGLHGKFHFEDTTLTNEIQDDDMPNLMPLNLTRGNGYEHSAYPAHTRNKAMYLHKLGDIGPVAFSSLGEAKKLYDLNSAHPMTDLKVR